MMSARETAASPVVRQLLRVLGSLRKTCNAIIAVRQRQADICVAMHLRELPENLLQRLGLPEEAVNKLRHPQRVLHETWSLND
jgi:hypothetical protein